MKKICCKIKFTTKYLVFIISLIYPVTISAVSLTELISNKDHNRLTTNPASIGGIKDGVFQSTISPCRPFKSLENQFSEGYSDEEKERKLEGSRGTFEFGRCIPVSGNFESNKGRINLNYEVEGNESVEYGAWSSTQGTLSDFLSNTNSTGGGVLIQYENQDFVTDSLRIGYGWENFGLELNFEANAEWQRGGSFFPNITNISGNSNPNEISEWREENVAGIGIGTFFGIDFIGPVQVGYRINRHDYRHEYYFSESTGAGIKGEGSTNSEELGILLPDVFNYFSLSSTYYYFKPEQNMNFTGGSVASIKFSQVNYLVTGLGLNLDTSALGFGFNIENAIEQGSGSFASSIRAGRLSFYGTDFYYGEKMTSYTAVKIKESTAEISIPYVQFGVKQYEIYVKKNLGIDYQSLGKVSYPTITLTAYFGPRGMFETPKRDRKNPQVFPNRSASRSSLEAAQGIAD